MHHLKLEIQTFSKHEGYWGITLFTYFINMNSLASKFTSCSYKLCANIIGTSKKKITRRYSMLIPGSVLVTG